MKYVSYDGFCLQVVDKHDNTAYLELEELDNLISELTVMHQELTLKKEITNENR